ncbi:MAG: glycosyltransferase [Lachnospiraceae bacterium]|nr:glycosyltransferase [Lachnospiraceae bacterium]
MKVTVIFTCFNRKEKTIAAIESLEKGNREHSLRYIIVDDNSTDGTVEAIEALNVNAVVMHGNGELYWSGGMRVGIGEFLQHTEESEYMLLINDDVNFYPNIIECMINRSIQNKDAIIVGATCDRNGNFSYGGLCLTNDQRKGLYNPVLPSEALERCDTFNCNCVLVKTTIATLLGNFDPMYRHSLADLDYGLSASKKGVMILSTDNYVGVCDKNSNKGTWHDKSLSRIQRFKKKESVKGDPIKPWFHFLRKNFGFTTAIKFSASPYIRIILGK